MKKIMKGRKLKYGSVAAALTLLVLVAVVILNMIAAALAGRYEWMYADMNSTLIYSISEDCEKYLGDVVIPEVDRANEGKNEKNPLEIIFCDSLENILADKSVKYIHDSVLELGEIFPGYITVDYLDIWNHPSQARELGITSTTDVVCKFGDRHETMNLADFYILDAAGSATAYNGEKIIASCLMRVTQKDTPMAYLTANHGEAFGDYEMMRMLVEAGYTVGFLDLSTVDIPEDCALLVTYDPKQDLIVADELSSQSEVDKINAYMEKGGKYMIFLSADTFVSGGRENMESFLADWGVKYMHKPGEGGIEDCYLVRDTSNALSVDGYTFLSQASEKGLGGQMMEGLGGSNVFANSTYISYAEGFAENGEGNATATVGGKLRTVSPLMLSHESAVAWANGKALSRAAGDPFMLMTVSAQECENGETSYLLCSASTEFASQASMQSAVLGNSRTLMGILRGMGKDNAPVELVFKPFGSTEIESLTTKTANTITVILTALPAVVFLGLGIVMLVRRRNT